MRRSRLTQKWYHFYPKQFTISACWFSSVFNDCILYHISHEIIQDFAKRSLITVCLRSVHSISLVYASSCTNSDYYQQEIRTAQTIWLHHKRVGTWGYWILDVEVALLADSGICLFMWSRNNWHQLILRLNCVFLTTVMMLWHHRNNPMSIYIVNNSNLNLCQITAVMSRYFSGQVFFAQTYLRGTLFTI